MRWKIVQINVWDVFWFRTVIWPMSHSRNPWWDSFMVYPCKCRCGKTKLIRKCHLLSWHSTKCSSCSMKENRKNRKNYKLKGNNHKRENKRFCRIYYWIRERCNCKTWKEYYKYWWKGIKCCWKSFEEFYDDMFLWYIEHVKEHWEKQTTIDRINSNWNYCKENCRWATYKTQSENRCNVKKIKYNWIEYSSLKDFCRKIWIKYQTMQWRLYRMWLSLEEAVNYNKFND